MQRLREVVCEVVRPSWLPGRMHIEQVALIVDDWEPYPANARPGAGRSIYD